MTPFSSEAFRAELALDTDLHYMNTGTSGPEPRASVEARCEALRRLARDGPGSLDALAWYGKTGRELRAALARFFGGTPERFALTQNTSEGINIVLNSLPFQSGDEIVTTNLEHGGLAIPLFHRARIEGVRLRILETKPDGDLIAAFQSVLSSKTRLLAISHVAFTDGRVLPVTALLGQARSKGIPTLLDAAQSAGHLPLRLDTLGADFVAIPGQKWLLGPDGIGALYLDGDWAERLIPDRVGWAGEAGFTLDGDYALKPDAARFEVGTRDPTTAAAWTASLDLLRGYGMEAIAARIREISRIVRERLEQRSGVSLLGPRDPAVHSGLISFTLAGADPPAVVKRLWRDHRVAARWIPAPYPPAVRVSLHAFLLDSDIDALFAGLAEVQALD